MRGRRTELPGALCGRGGGALDLVRAHWAVEFGVLRFPVGEYALTEPCHRYVSRVGKVVVPKEMAKYLVVLATIADTQAPPRRHRAAASPLPGPCAQAADGGQGVGDLRFPLRGAALRGGRAGRDSGPDRLQINRKRVQRIMQGLGLQVQR